MCVPGSPVTLESPSAQKGINNPRPLDCISDETEFAVVSVRRGELIKSGVSYLPEDENSANSAMPVMPPP